MEMSKRPGEIAIGVGLVAIGVIWGCVALTYDLGSLSQPGPGFFPAGLSFFLACTGAWVVANAAAQKTSDRPAEADREQDGRVTFGSAGFVSAVASLVFIAVFLEYLGFMIVTGVTVTIMLRQFGGYRWPVALAGGVATAVISYFFFVTALGVRLPMFAG